MTFFDLYNNIRYYLLNRKFPNTSSIGREKMLK